MAPLRCAATSKQPEDAEVAETRRFEPGLLEAVRSDG